MPTPAAAASSPMVSTPAATAASGVLCPSLGGSCDEATEERLAVGRAEQRVARPLGVRHQADDVATLVAHAGDVVDRAVRVVDVAEHDAVAVLQLAQGLGAARVV